MPVGHYFFLGRRRTTAGDTSGVVTQQLRVTHRRNPFLLSERNFTLSQGCAQLAACQCAVGMPPATRGAAPRLQRRSARWFSNVCPLGVPYAKVPRQCVQQQSQWIGSRVGIRCEKGLPEPLTFLVNLFGAASKSAKRPGQCKSTSSIAGCVVVGALRQQA